ncbi:hypothetical protein HanIR_Chr16g0824221 [Helianthus annuus]|nr:hypothetical protein HanIR_Chr16g0824221 [Helianthus annuus]
MGAQKRVRHYMGVRGRNAATPPYIIWNGRRSVKWTSECRTTSKRVTLKVIRSHGWRSSDKINEPNTPLRSFRYVKFVKQWFFCCNQSLKQQYYVLLLFLVG